MTVPFVTEHAVSARSRKVLVERKFHTRSELDQKKAAGFFENKIGPCARGIRGQRYTRRKRSAHGEQRSMCDKNSQCAKRKVCFVARSPLRVKVNKISPRLSGLGPDVLGKCPRKR